MELMLISGAISLVFGVLFLFFPKTIHRWSELSNRKLSELDPTIMSHRIGTGLCLLAVGLFCLTSAYYVWLRLHP